MRPGFDALGMSAPFIVQMNPEGKWENKKPDNLDEGRMKAIIQHLANSNAISAAQSYCCQCAAEDQVKIIETNLMFRIMSVTTTMRAAAE